MHDMVAMLRQIQAIQFAAIELHLYLNTHPRDQRALEEYNELVCKLEQLEAEYTERYGMLYMLQQSGFPWEWNREPWPWDINYSA